jgi:hypothetical protein
MQDIELDSSTHNAARAFFRQSSSPCDPDHEQIARFFAGELDWTEARDLIQRCSQNPSERSSLIRSSADIETLSKTELGQIGERGPLAAAWKQVVLDRLAELSLPTRPISPPLSPTLRALLYSVSEQLKRRRRLPQIGTSRGAQATTLEAPEPSVARQATTGLSAYLPVVGGELCFGPWLVHMDGVFVPNALNELDSWRISDCLQPDKTHFIIDSREGELNCWDADEPEVSVGPIGIVRTSDDGEDLKFTLSSSETVRKKLATRKLAVRVVVAAERWQTLVFVSTWDLIRKGVVDIAVNGITDPGLTLCALRIELNR